MAKGDETEGAPGPQPEASNMKEMVWNSELERIAQRWADQCGSQGVHEPNSEDRQKADGTAVGQNVFQGSASNQASGKAILDTLDEGVQMWYDEVKEPGLDRAVASQYV